MPSLTIFQNIICLLNKHENWKETFDKFGIIIDLDNMKRYVFLNGKISRGFKFRRGNRRPFIKF